MNQGLDKESYICLHSFIAAVDGVSAERLVTWKVQPGRRNPNLSAFREKKHNDRLTMTKVSWPGEFAVGSPTTGLEQVFS